MINYCVQIHTQNSHTHKKKLLGASPGERRNSKMFDSDANLNHTYFESQVSMLGNRSGERERRSQSYHRLLSIDLDKFNRRHLFFLYLTSSHQELWHLFFPSMSREFILFEDDILFRNNLICRKIDGMLNNLSYHWIDGILIIVR